MGQFECLRHFARRRSELAKHPACGKYALGGYRGNSREILRDYAYACGQAFVVGVGKFSHCIVTRGEIISSVLAGSATSGDYLRWLLIATLGDIVGGVVIVGVLNYGQVRVI